MQRAILLFLLFVTLRADSLYAHVKQPYTINSLTMLDGLSQNDVRDIIQDSYGFIWAATYDGVCRYDGYEFKRYSIGDLGLTSNMALCLAEDNNRNIWIGMSERGLFCYVRAKNRFFHISELTDDTQYINSNIRNVAVDKGGNIWCAGRDNMIIRIKYDVQSNRVIEKAIVPVSTKDDIGRINIIKQTESGLYLSTLRALFRYDEKRERFVTALGNNRMPNIRSIAQQGDRLFLAKNDRLISVDINNGEVQDYGTFNPPFRFSWADDKLWVTSRKGVWCATYDSLDNSFDNFEQVDTYNNIIPNVIVANENGVWVGLIKAGIRQYSKKSTSFYINRGFGNDHIQTIYSTSDNKLLLGGYGGGFYELDSVDGSAIKRDDIESESTIFSMCEIGDNTFISTSFGVYRLWGEDRENREKLFSDRVVYKITPDINYLWFATWGEGVVRYNYITGATRYFTTESGLPSNIVRNMLIDSKGDMWICTYEGVAKIAKGDRFKDSPRITTFTTDNYPTIPIIEDKSGAIWYGTLGYGLYCVMEGRTMHFSREDGLSSNIIKSIQEDDSGAIWIATNRGLNQLIKGNQSYYINSFDIHNNLQDYEFNELSSAKLPDGTLVFGGVAGYNYFNPNEFTTDDVNAKLVITDFEIGGKSIFLNSDIEEIIPNGIVGDSGVNLKYDQNNITLKFAALHYTNTSKFIYKYRLQGVDKEWITNTSDEREVNYTNLKSGRYIFSVKATNGYSAANEEELVIPINIEYPIWERWYAIVTYIILISLIVFYIVRYYRELASRRTAARIANIERQKIEEMLEMRTRFFTNVSHEFRTPLTLVLSPLQQLMEDEYITKHRGYNELLNTMSHNGESLMRLINEFLSYTKEESGELTAQLSLGDFTAHIENLFSQFRYWANRESISLSYHQPKEGVMLNFDPYLMEQIIYNLLSNAIKHTGADGKIELSIENRAERVRVMIKDNGCGIPVEQQPYIFNRFFSKRNGDSNQIGGTGIGLFLTKKLIELHSGEIWVESTLQEGTTFYIEFPKEASHGDECDMQERIAISSIQPEEQCKDDSALESDMTLLIIDDNIELLHLLDNLFKSRYKILLAHDGQEGWSVASTMLPDIIISDVMMPHMDGIELCERIKNDARTSHIPLILLSAKSSNEDVVAGLRATADGYCPKPFNNSVLREMVNSLIANRCKLVNNLSATNVQRVGDKALRFPDFCDSATNNIDKIFIKRLVTYVEENISRADLTAAEICDYMGVTSFILNKKLKSLFEMTIVVFLRTIRLRRAATMLVNENRSVADVTYDVGFSDLKYFRTCFKEEFGVSPLDYKNTPHS